MPTTIPLTLEAEWLANLSRIRCWEPPVLPTLILAPHPDDETLGCGGMIARLRGRSNPVTIAAITDGENAYPAALGLGPLRIEEQALALQRLGVSRASVHRFHLPDSNVQSFEAELVNRIAELATQKMHLVAPWPHDFHPDHEATGRAAKQIAERFGFELTYYLFWTWHRGTPDLLKTRSLVSLPLSELERTTKLHALQAHTSQFQHPSGQPILNADLIRPAQRSFEVYIR
jgi:LmbE family N-acetylglucosaminyl deacetylase